MTSLDDISGALPLVRRWLNNRQPEIAVVLGSGLSTILEPLSDARILSYEEIPGFVGAGVAGHAGRLHSGTLYGKSVLVFEGRYHFYEGYTAWQVTAPVRLAASVGCQKLLLTNAAGGIHKALQPGDFMLVTDHLNLTGVNPLRGRSEREFLDLTNLYSADFFPELSQKLQDSGIFLHHGVLAWMPGPSYETPAEISVLAMLGADAVSMSTIPEALVAKLYGLETVAFSSISNLAAGLSSVSLDHQDVLARGVQSSSSLNVLLSTLFHFWLSN